MKIAVVPASGKVGLKVVEECLKRGHHVTAFIKKDKKIDFPKVNVVYKDLFDIVKSDLEGFDAVVDAFGTSDKSKIDHHVSSLMHLCALLEGSTTRLLVVGGAGSLYIDKKHTKQVFETEDFPKAYYETSKYMAEALKQLRKKDKVRWTYISPALNFEVDGKKTNQYAISGETLSFNKHGESKISYSDYVFALVDEIQRAKHIQRRISVLSK